MKDIEPYISTFVEQQFPAFYRDEGPMFVSFVKAYYEWMEQENNVLYHSRRIPSYKDIDETTEDFILHFKEKYLPDIQFETESNKRLFIKNALDFYRSKGTKRSVDLFFKLIYGIPATVYYPGDDLFKLSDGEWVQPLYLEVTPSTKNLQFVGKEIVGSISGATAFVDDLVVKKAKGKYIHVMYISSLSGDFQTGELIAYDSDYDNNPTIVGSLSSFDITSGGADFDIGETVNFISNNGSFGKALVTGVDSTSGLVTFELSDGGFGYNSNSQILISNNVITVANVSNLAFSLFETVSQPVANIVFKNANGTIANTDLIYRYYANGTQAGLGQVLSTTQVGTNGSILVSVISGNLQLGTANLFVNANTITGNTLTYTDKTATGNVIGISSNTTLLTDTATGPFTIGEYLYTPSNAAIGVIRSISTDGSNTIILLSNTSGIFNYGLTVTGSVSGQTAVARTYTKKIGVRSVVNRFYASANNITSGGSSTANGLITAVSEGSGASFSLASNTYLSNTQTVNVNSDKISTNATYWLPIAINATQYNFPGAPTGNLTSSTIGAMLSWASKTYGVLTNNSIIGINPGTGYTEDPFVVVYEPETYQTGLKDYAIGFSGATGQFTPGEIIKQSNSTGGLVVNGAIGLVMTTNTTDMSVKRLSITNSFSEFITGNNYIVGASSNSIALLVSTTPNNQSNAIGINALIFANAATSNGSVANLEVITSGFGYVDGETVTFYNSEDSTQTGTVILQLEKQGVGAGYYRTTGGFLSSNKYIHDGDYYQEYSYEILSKLPFERYADMIKKVIHVAGTKVFGAYVEEELSNNDITVASASLTYPAANSTGTISVNTTVSNAVGTSTTFSSLFANGDTIRIIANTTLTVEKRIVQVVNNTLLILSGPSPATNTAANFSKVNSAV